MGRRGWVYAPKPAKLEDWDKRMLERRVREFVKASDWLGEAVSRMAIRGGRITLYHLVEQMNPDQSLYDKPLIDGKYLEFPLARLTVYEKRGEQCSIDWQRHTGQWYSVMEGTLDECLQFLQENKSMFYPY